MNIIGRTKGHISIFRELPMYTPVYNKEGEQIGVESSAIYSKLKNIEHIVCHSRYKDKLKAGLKKLDIQFAYLKDTGEIIFSEKIKKVARNCIISDGTKRFNQDIKRQMASVAGNSPSTNTSSKEAINKITKTFHY